MSEDKQESDLSDMSLDSRVSGFSIYSDKKENWYVKAGDEGFLDKNGDIVDIDDNKRPTKNIVYSSLEDATNTANMYNDIVDTEEGTDNSVVLGTEGQNEEQEFYQSEDDQEISKSDQDADNKSQDSQLLGTIVGYLGTDIADYNQERPDSRNVKIEFINRGDNGIQWSEDLREFWEKLSEARNGDKETRKDLYIDFKSRYKNLILKNRFARGDFIDTVATFCLSLLGLMFLTFSILSFLLGSPTDIDVLSSTSGYGDYVIITTIFLSISSLLFFISRRIKSKTIVSALRTPISVLIVGILAIQVAIFGVISSTLLIGGGQEQLARIEVSLTSGVISLASSLPQGVSQYLINFIESYRGPESSIFGLSILQSSLVMSLVGLISLYPVLKRTLARFVLTANMSPREFREKTGILVEQISKQSSSFETPGVGAESQSTTEKAYDSIEFDTEDLSDEMIALPNQIKSSPFDNYKEVTRYWVRAPYAYVSIVYNERQNDYRYIVKEPELDGSERVIFDEIKQRLDNVLLFEDIEEYEDVEKEREAKLEKLENKMVELSQEYDISLNHSTFHRLMYYIERDYIYYNKIDPLINDPNVEDISCDGEDQYIFVFHSDHKDVITNIKFEKEELRSFIQEIAQRSGEHISSANPMIDASLPDGSRAQLTLGSEVTTRGSTFTIRLFEDIPFTPIDLLDSGTFSLTQMAYLWTAIENNKSLIFAGGTASGKTTSMNAVSMFIPPKAKVITIEDTREISLPQENWIPGTTREGVGGEQGGDDIDMYELLRAALRQRPEYIVVGEIRGEEAETLFQAMNTGHTTYSTMHAETVNAVVGRLTNPPINVPKQMITALDIICIQNQIRLTDDEGNQQNIRRNEETKEIVSLRDSGRFESRRPFQWDAETDTFIESLEESHVLERVANENGWKQEDKRKEIERRKKVLRHMSEEDIRDFDLVTNIIQAYMVDSQKIINGIEQDDLNPEELRNLTDMEWETKETDESDMTLNQMTQQVPENQGDTE